MKKISVIMPAYNMAEYLERSIESVLNQTMTDVEIICVDDCSEDESVEIVKRYVRKDSRVKLIENDTKQSALAARKSGVLAADSEYILFLDADDYLERNACEELYKLAEKEKVDILHFQARIVGAGASEERIRNMQKFVSPYLGELQDKDVFVKAFREQKYRFSIWNKIYRTQLCKEAMGDITDGFLLKANDMILYTAIAMYAKSYKGVDTEYFYNYSFGSGSTGSSDLSLKQFEVYCYEAKAARLFAKIVEKHDSKCEYTDIVEAVKRNLLKDCIYNFKSNLSDDKASKGFDLLVQFWGIEDAVAGLAEAYAMNRATLISRIEKAECLTIHKETIKTLGIYYHRIGKGGVQRVLSLLMPLYLELGYEIVLFTDEYEPESEYEIPKQVKRIVLTSALTINYPEYGIRAKELLAAIQTYHIDAMLYHAAECRTLAYDMLLTKGMGLPFCVSVHGLFSAELLNSNSLLCEKVKTFKLIDRLIVLSETEKTFWEIFGIPAIYIPNPIQEIEGKREAEDYILWLGRFESVQKQHMDAINIMNAVVKVHPEAKMRIVGNEVTHDAKKNMLKRIATLKLEDNIELCDYTTNVDAFYKEAGIFLVTSATESFAMTIVESKGYGIPLVTYDMPYLETLKDKRGYISVPQNDIKAAAGAIIKLLEDDALRERLGKEARAGYEAFRNFDLKAAWSSVLKSLVESREDSKKDTLDRENVELVIQTLLFHYQKGSNKLKNQLAQAKKVVPVKEASNLQYIEIEDSKNRLQVIRIKFHNLYVHYRKKGAKEAWRVIMNKLRR